MVVATEFRVLRIDAVIRGDGRLVGLPTERRLWRAEGERILGVESGGCGACVVVMCKRELLDDEAEDEELVRFIPSY